MSGPGRFVRYALRTNDVPAARAFYDGLLTGGAGRVEELPARAARRGAPPHWLGHIGVEDVERAAEAFVARGAQRLGPTRSTADGELALLRNPGGAVVALSPAATAPRADIDWHLLHTLDLERTRAAYFEVLGWTPGVPIEVGPRGVLHPFSYAPGAPPAGALIEAGPGVHPHWLFRFRITSLDEAMASVRHAGGTVVGPFTLPDGARTAVCEDPQGAAFAIG